MTAGQHSELRRRGLCSCLARVVRIVARLPVTTTEELATTEEGLMGGSSSAMRSLSTLRRTTRRAIVSASIAGVLLSSLLAACSENTAPPPASTPAAAAKAYYRSIAQHRLDAAAGYVAPGARGSTTSENENYRTLTRMRISAAKNISVTLLPDLVGISISHYRAFAQVAVSYYATYDHIIDADNGHRVDFLYLGNTRDKTIGWQILGVGSGP